MHSVVSVLDSVIRRNHHEKEMLVSGGCTVHRFFLCLLSLDLSRLFSLCERLPGDLFDDFRIDHQVFFSMAIGHWIVSKWEDGLMPSLHGVTLDRQELQKVAPKLRDVQDLSNMMLTAYAVHHVFAVVAYAILLRMQRCAVVGVFGLLFELPALWLTKRELAHPLESTRRS